MSINEIDAEIISKSIKGEKLTINDLRKMIKKSLSKVFGAKNVIVKKKSNYLIQVFIRTERPHDYNCNNLFCDKCNIKYSEVYKKAFNTIHSSKISDYIYKEENKNEEEDEEYYSDLYYDYVGEEKKYALSIIIFFK